MYVRKIKVYRIENNIHVFGCFLDFLARSPATEQTNKQPNNNPSTVLYYYNNIISAKSII